MYQSPCITLAKWHDASRIKDEYAYDMEMHWPVLHYCDNHWKAHKIATQNYPQWYKNYHKKKLKVEEKNSDEPAQKKHRTVIEDDENVQSLLETETNTLAGNGLMPEDVHMGENDDKNDGGPSLLLQDNKEGAMGGTSRPQV